MLPSFYCLLFYEASVVTLCNLRHVSNDEIKVTLVLNVLTKRLQFCTEIKNSAFKNAKIEYTYNNHIPKYTKGRFLTVFFLLNVTFQFFCSVHIIRDSLAKVLLFDITGGA